MQQDQMTTNSNDQEVPQSQEGGSPLDDIISKVQSYKSDLKLVTPQTLDDLLSELTDLKSYLDEEETQQGETQDQPGRKGLTIMIDNAKHGGMK